MLPISARIPNFLQAANELLPDSFKALANITGAGAATPEQYDVSQNQWNTGDFWNHYIHGDGETIDLKNVGLLDDFRNSSSGVKIQETWQADVQERINQKISELSARSTATGIPQTETFQVEDWYVYKQYDPTSPLFSLGGGGMTVSASCKVTVDKASGKVEWSADLDYSAKDKFTEPFLFFGWAGIPGDLPTTKPYDITFSWATKMTSAQPTPVDQPIESPTDTQALQPFGEWHNPSVISNPNVVSALPTGKGFGLWVE